MHGIEKPIIKDTKPFTKPSTAEEVLKNMEWLKKYNREYQGQWVALEKGILLGSDENFTELNRRLTNSGKDMRRAVFMNLKIGM